MSDKMILAYFTERLGLALDYEPKFSPFISFMQFSCSQSLQRIFFHLFWVFNVFKPAASCAQTGGVSTLTSADTNMHAEKCRCIC